MTLPRMHCLLRSNRAMVRLEEVHAVRKRQLMEHVQSRQTASRRVLVVRLGAMGDILHALPAVAWLKQSHPGSHLTWLVEPRWASAAGRESVCGPRGPIASPELRRGLMETRRELRAAHYDFAVDFQGLLKSAMAASARVPTGSSASTSRRCGSGWRRCSIRTRR